MKPWLGMGHAVAMLKPYEGELVHYAVSDELNKVGKVNNASLLEPVAEYAGHDLGLF